MIDNNATSANATGLLDNSTPDQIKARISQFCEWFELTPPQVKTHKGQVRMTGDFLQWIKDAGASIDWIVCKDVKCMARAYRQNRLTEQQGLTTFRALDPTGREMLLETLRAVVENKVSGKDAIEAYGHALKSRRK